jgi:hypothetical protein
MLSALELTLLIELMKSGDIGKMETAAKVMLYAIPSLDTASRYSKALSIHR